MNIFLNTKPSFPPSKATSRGWVDVETGELLVAIRDLDKKLGADIQETTEAIKRGPGRPKGSKAKPKKENI